MFLAVFNAFVIPLEMARFQSEEDIKGIQAVANNFVDLAFFIDLVLMFFASYRNNKGVEIDDPKQIFIHYVMSKRFFSDFGSIIGQFFSVIRPGSNLSYLSILKMTRVLRISGVI